MVSLNEVFFISVGLTVESHNKWECAPTFFRGKGIGGGYISLSQEWERGGRLFKTWPVILCLLNHFYSINSIAYFFYAVLSVLCHLPPFPHPLSKLYDYPPIKINYSGFDLFSLWFHGNDNRHLLVVRFIWRYLAVWKSWSSVQSGWFLKSISQIRLCSLVNRLCRILNPTHQFLENPAYMKQ